VSKLTDGNRPAAAARRLVRKAETSLLAARRLAEHGGQKEISTECRQALTARLADDAQRATALRDRLSPGGRPRHRNRRAPPRGALPTDRAREASARRRWRTGAWSLANPTPSRGASQLTGGRK